MESVTRWIFIALAAFLAWTYLPDLIGGGGSSEVQPIGPGRTETAVYAIGAGAPAKCEIQGNKFSAVLSARSAALVDFYMTGDERYTENGKPIELTTVPGSAPDRFALHFDWRAMRTTDNAQVANDVVDWTIASRDASSCTFTYADENVRLTKTIRAGSGPFELVTRATVENLAPQPRVHRLGVENTAFRTHAETDSHLGRVSPVATEVACAHDGGKVDRKALSDFEPKAFANPEYEAGWFLSRGAIEFAAADNAYFSQAIVPIEAPAAPACALQIEERWSWDKYPDKTKAPDYSAMYRSRLVYPAKELATHETATYEVGAYYGPKDRDTLSRAFAGKYGLSEIINLGMFSVVSKVLVMFLIKAHDVVGNWGIAIIVLTICVRLLMFPLTWKQIKSMVAMRRLKPEIDELNRKFKDDPQQKQVAMMEVYRKNGVNPLGGCLPVLVQMPVWWALYTVLQTAVELYHTPFLWFRDLSAPDPYFLLPIVIGAASFVQQKMMPQQADIAQQKMMLYFMPAVFTVMMLFLPAGLGIYMLTNSILGIVQQQAVERFAPHTTGIEVRESDVAGNSPANGKKGKEPKLAGTLPAKLKGGS